MATRKTTKMNKEEQAKHYNPAAIKIGNDYLDERDIKKMQTAVDNPDDAKAKEEINRTVLARAMTEPEVTSASIIQRLDANLDINYVAQELRDQSAIVRKGDMSRAEEMLIAQAHSLDALFGNLARRAHGNMEAGYLQATETYLRLALRAQNQCRSTLETLSAIKNPPLLYAKQVNMANGPQQVNNGVVAKPNPSRTLENETAPNELGEPAHELLQDSRASSITSGAVPEPETVGAIYRSED